MIIYECEQGTPDWLAARLGKVTASCFGKAIAGGRGKTRKTYMIQLIAERLANEVQETYTNTIMQRGSDLEPYARDYYAQLNNCTVEQIGFIEHDADTGASPDGLIGANGMIEIKCPNSTTHIETLLMCKMPTAHKPQVQGQLWVAERQWADFVSFDPRIKQKPFFCQRIYRDEEYIKELENKISVFIAQMYDMIQKLTKSPF